MNKKFWWLGICLLGVGFFCLSCGGGGGGGGSVEGIPRAFFNALADGKVDKLLAMTTGSFTAEAKNRAAQFENMKISISKWTVKAVKDVAADHKTVRVEFVSKTESKDGRGFPRKMKQDQIFHLKNVDGKWLISKIAVGSPPVSVE